MITSEKQQLYFDMCNEYKQCFLNLYWSGLNEDNGNEELMEQFEDIGLESSRRADKFFDKLWEMAYNQGYDDAVNKVDKRQHELMGD